MMVSYSRDGRLLEGSAYMIIARLEWALVIGMLIYGVLSRNITVNILAKRVSPPRGGKSNLEKNREKVPVREVVDCQCNCD